MSQFQTFNMQIYYKVTFDIEETVEKLTEKSVNFDLSEQDLITFKEELNQSNKASETTSTSSISKSSSILSYSGTSSQLNLSSDSDLKTNNNDLKLSDLKQQQQFKIESFDFFKVHGQEKTPHCYSAELEKNKVANQFLQTEINKHLRTKKSESDEYSSDVIPFDECEYEKIAISSSSSEFTHKTKLEISEKMLNKSMESGSSGSVLVSSSESNSETKQETSLMKNSRTESELNSMKKIQRNRHRSKTLSHQRKSSVYNDLSYYYSLTDVKSYEDEEDDEEKNISSSSLSFSSPSSSASSSRRTYSSQSLDEDYEFFAASKLQKSITLPNASEMARLASIDMRKSKSSVSLNSDHSSTAEKSDRVCEMPSLYRNTNHKSLSDYCMSDVLKQKRRRRLIRFFKSKRGEFLEKWRGSVKSLTQLSDLADESDESGAPTPIRRRLRSKCNRCESSSAAAGYLKDGDDEADEEDFYRPNSTPTTTTNSSIETSSSLNPESQIDTEHSSPVKINQVNHEIINEFPKQINNLPTVNNETASLNTAAIDETSTTNTDVSDPHWDGYTSSPYYSTPVTVENISINEKTQPILPWDELFFELEPIDDVPKQRINTSHKKQRPRRSVSSFNPNTFHHHYYHHSNNNHQKQSRELTKSVTCCACCSGLKRRSEGSSETSSGFNNSSSDAGSSSVSNSNTATQHEVFWYPFLRTTMNDLTTVLQQSLLQCEQTYDLINLLKSNQILTSQTVQSNVFLSQQNDYYESDERVEHSSYNQTTNKISTNSNFLNPDAYLIKYNEILATCQTNTNSLVSYRNSLVKRSKDEDGAEDEEIRTLYLNELNLKWKTVEKMAAEENLNWSVCKKSIEDLSFLKDTLKSILNCVEQLRKFDSLTSLIEALKELENKNFQLSELLNKLNEIKSKFAEYLERVKESDADKSDGFKRAFDEEANKVEQLHTTASTSLKVKIAHLTSLADKWSSAEDSLQHLNTLFSKHDSLFTSFPPSRLDLKQISDSIDTCSQSLEELKRCSIESHVNIDSQLSHDWFKLDELKTRYINLTKPSFKSDIFHSTLKNDENVSFSPIRKTNPESNSCKISSSIQHEIEMGSKKRCNYKANLTMDNGVTTNIHLDFHNESLSDDMTNFQMTSTPRYNHIEIENTMGGDLAHSKPKHSLLLTSKTFSDKAVSTVENKSSQTEVNVGKFGSMGDSGISSHLEESKLASRSISTPRIEQGAQTSKSIQHVEKIVEKQQSLFHETSSEDEEVEQIEENFMLRKRVVKENVEEEVVSPLDVDLEAETKRFSFKRFFKYSFFFAIILGLLVFFLLPKLVPACCDFNRGYLIFNEQKLDDNLPLPF